jgi:hypothetical protein
MNDIQCGAGTRLTYHEFFEKFNAITRGYHARVIATQDGEPVGVIIVLEYDGSSMAMLGSEASTWTFNDSAFDWGELDLMAQLATTSPELRGGINNGD